MIEKKVIIYICEHCKKKYYYKKVAQNHEPNCKLNKANFNQCFGCAHKVKKETDVLIKNFTHSIETRYTKSKRNLYFCEKLQTFITPAYIANRRGVFITEAYENIIMPAKCKDFKEIDYNNLVF